MLKKFLKLFKHDEEQPPVDLEGSYLDYLLTHIERGVEQELRQCKDHDPILLVITTTLRIAMPGAWSDRIQRPLLDASRVMSRAAPPPPPPQHTSMFPPPPPGVEEKSLEDTNEFETSELGEEIIGEELETLEEERSREQIDESADDVLELDDEAAESLDEEELDEESDIIEEITAVKTAAYEATGEFHALRDIAELEKEDEAEEQLPRLDSKEVLQAGRVLLGMLIENDRLPVELQLGLEELILARDLLMGQHLGVKNLEGKAQQLLRIVERKFSEGQFSQARILLQLFQTDRPTRVRNDRNIFYEDMIQRLGIRRRHPVADDLIQEYRELETGDEPIRDLSKWLDHKIFIKFHLFCRRSEEVQRWSALGEQFSQPHAREMLLRYIPPKRWRPFFSLVQENGQVLQESATLIHDAEPLTQLVLRHLHSDTLSNYVISHIRTCYFVLRAVGDTGLEKYLDTFFDWTRDQLDCNATAFLPELYRRSMGETDMMRSIFLDLYARYFRENSERWLQTISEEDVITAMEKVQQTLQACNLNDIPPGNYDLGGFIYDALFGVTYPTPEFAFKVHRLT